jgi:cytidylate kinase
MNLQIIGISGTNGSGKDTVGQLLADQYGYLFISVTELLRAEATRRREPVEREVLRTISAEWRRESGLGVLIDKAFAEYELHKDRYSGLAVASLRNPGEADRVHDLGGTVIWVDADAHIRYDRIQINADLRNRVEEDKITFEQFVSEEAAEMHASGDAATLDMAAVKERADIFLTNDSTDMDALQAALKTTLQLQD